MIEVTSLDKIGNKGLYSFEMFGGMLPKGRAGKVITYKTGKNSMTYKLGAKIGTREHLLSATIVSNFLNDLGDDFKRYKDHPEEIKTLEDEADHVGNPRLKYTHIVFNLADLAEQMYKGDRKYAKRLKASFQNLEQLLVVFENEVSLFNPKKQFIDSRHFKDFSYKDGIAQIGISNQMLQVIIPFVRGIRLDKVLQYNNFTAELSLYVEHYQYGVDKGSNPHQTYSLADIVKTLGLTEDLAMAKSRTIQKIQDSFDEMSKTDKDFPRYIYDENKQFFYNKYKKGANKLLFK